jgi:hypothetical protein
MQKHVNTMHTTPTRLPKLGRPPSLALVALTKLLAQVAIEDFLREQQKNDERNADAVRGDQAI